MKKIISFFKLLWFEMNKDDVFSLADELTYKLVLSFLPFLIFLMTILGYANIDTNALLVELSGALPEEIVHVMEVFVTEVFEQKNASLLSGSLFISIFSASSGFNAIIRGINQSYGQEETRHFIVVHLISIALVLIFTVSILLSLLLLIYGDAIFGLLNSYLHVPLSAREAFGKVSFAITLIMLMITVTLIYLLASCKKLSLRKVLPGSAITVILWFAASKGFHIYVENFTRYSKVYGGIGNVFVLLIWLNIISLLLLIGSEINAILQDNAKKSIP